MVEPRGVRRLRLLLEQVEMAEEEEEAQHGEQELEQVCRSPQG